MTPAAVVESELFNKAATTRSRRRLVRLGRHSMGIAGALVLVLVVLAATVVPFITDLDPETQDLRGRLIGPWQESGGGRFYPLGSDQLGRDILARVIYGARTSLLIGFVAVAATALIGVPFGLVAGYAGGWIDRLIMTLVNLQLSFPFILLAIVMVSLVGVSVVNIILIFSVTSWPIYARTVRAQILVTKELEFVNAARSSGATKLRILTRHLLPQVIGPLIVIASFEVSRLIILEAALGFLGLSVKPPDPTWGNMLADGRQYVTDAWWIAAVPGLAITLTAAAVNFVGDALRDIADPRSSYW